MLVTVLLLGLLITAAVTDVRGHKIYNWNTYGGTLAALALNAVGEAVLAFGQGDYEPRKQWLEKWLGYVGFYESLTGFLLCGFVLLVCFVFFQVGGGDVKLMAMLGALLGPYQGIEALLWTFVLGACVALIVLVWRVGPWPLVVRVFRQVVWTLRLRSWAALSEEERKQLQTRLFLAPAAVGAAVIVRFSLATMM